MNPRSLFLLVSLIFASNLSCDAWSTFEKRLMNRNHVYHPFMPSLMYTEFVLTAPQHRSTDHHGKNSNGFCLAVAIEDPCLNQCRENITTKLSTDPQLSHFKTDEMGSTEGRAKVRTFIKNYVRGTGTVPAAVGNAESWTKLCTIATESETCIDQCPDSAKKEGVKKFLLLFKLGCDNDFKTAIACLAQVNKQRSETCENKCQSYGARLSTYIDQRERNPTDRTPAPRDVLESGCKFVNCRLNCRKSDIVNKCREQGFEQAKKLTSATAQSSKMLYKRTGGDLTNWPDICKSDKIIEYNEY